MSRRVFYMAHPVSGDVDGNIKRALRWLSWLRRSFPAVTFIAPWIAGLMSGEDDSDPTQREAGLVDCCAAVERCDGIVAVGGRVSSGMIRERRHAKHLIDLTYFGADPPAGPYEEIKHGWCEFAEMTGGEA